MDVMKINKSTRRRFTKVRKSKNMSDKSLTIPEFQQLLLNIFEHYCGPDRSKWDWLYEFDEEVDFDKLFMGVDMRKHLVKKGSTALCGHPVYVELKYSMAGLTRSSYPIRGEILYCSKCMQFDVSTLEDADDDEIMDERAVCGHCHAAGATLRCSVCREQKYCSTECQSGHWKKHKPQCKHLKKMHELNNMKLDFERFYI